MTYNELPVEDIKLEDIPLYHKDVARMGSSSLIKCGDVKRGGNEPYCYVEEKQCAGHICRVLSPDKTYQSALVIRDDGTVWKIDFSCFEEVYRINITDRRSGYESE